MLLPGLPAASTLFWLMKTHTWGHRCKSNVKPSAFFLWLDHFKNTFFLILLSTLFFFWNCPFIVQSSCLILLLLVAKPFPLRKWLHCDASCAVTTQAVMGLLSPIHPPVTNPRMGSALFTCGIKWETHSAKMESIKPSYSSGLRDGDIEVWQEHHKANNTDRMPALTPGLLLFSGREKRWIEAGPLNGCKERCQLAQWTSSFLSSGRLWCYF